MKNGSETDERLEFSWPGKREAREEALLPPTSRLVPCPEESFHWDETENLYFEGDNLEVLRLLQETHAGKVRLIYIDPPYNTGRDFIFCDRFHSNGETQEKVLRKTSGKPLHGPWCSMMLPRLILARNLLAEDGAICISIDDHEAAYLRLLCDEVFGPENFVAQLVWQTKREAKGIPPKLMCVPNHEYILVYARTQNFRFLGDPRNVQDGFSNPDGDPRGPWKRQYLQRFGQGFRVRSITNPENGMVFSFETPYTEEKMAQWVKEGRIIFPTSRDKFPARKEFFGEYANPFKPIVTSLGLFSTKVGSEELKRLFGNVKVFDYAKPLDLLVTLFRRTIREGIILDFFSGSATTGHAVMKLNAEDDGRWKFILVQCAEPCGEKTHAAQAGFAHISEIGKERLRRAAMQFGTLGIDSGFRVFKTE